MDCPKLNGFPELISDEILKRAESLGAALISDGMKGLDMAKGGCMAADIKPVDKGMAVVGTAVTVETADGDNLPIHLAIYSSRPGYVLVIDGKGYKDKAYIGDLIISAAACVGFKGIVIDGFSRDVLRTIEIGLPVFSAGFTPCGPGKKDMGNVNVPIICSGVGIDPGDLVVGDADGVVVVPFNHIEDVLKNAEEKLVYEEGRRKEFLAYRAALSEGGALPDLTPRWATEMLKMNSSVR